jgi:hypothetical protein
MNPYHYYSAVGNYIVTLIIDNGAQSDTSTQVVPVDSVLYVLHSSLTRMKSLCAGDYHILLL